MRALFLLLLCPFLGGAVHAERAGGGKVYLSVTEALELAFPECEVERRKVFLTDEERERAGEWAGEPVPSGVVRPYVATRDGELVGTAYFDTHVVRTKRQTLMFVVAPDRTIRRLEVLAFAEPTDYVPRAKWYAQFQGRALDDELRLDRKIRGVTGATLTARATTAAARRALALHAVVFPPKDTEGDTEGDGDGEDGVAEASTP